MITATALRTGRWELTPARTSVGFAVRNFGVATGRGQIPVTAAWVDVDDAGRPAAVHAELDLTRIDTGNGGGRGLMQEESSEDDAETSGHKAA